MATRKEVTCINKRGTHHNPHERIERIGGVYGGVRWSLPESAAITNIRFNVETYYVLVNGHSVNVIVAMHNGREYLKTENDGYAPNNLLSLSECPRL